jgi:RNA polymerase sigma-70 factor (ECF subfamily)
MPGRDQRSEVVPGSTSGFSEPEFVARLQSGERDALEAVVHAYLRQIHRAARGAGLDADRADDVVQETFKSFVEGISRCEGRSHVRTWLFGILYRKVAEARRGLGRERKFDDIDDVFESRFDERGSWSRPPRPADRESLAKETRQEISECLDAAPDRQRMAFLLREVEGFSTTEICKILGVTDTNLGVMLHRLRNRVRECLEARGVTGTT